jgi:peptide chain release factor 2
MQERTSLEDSLAGIGKVERELEDNVGMIELGEAENDEGVVAEAEVALKGLKKEGRRGRPIRLLSRSSRRRRRHREPGLGLDAAAHVHALGREARL